MPSETEETLSTRGAAGIQRAPPLTAGARIALVAPAGPLADGAAERALNRVRAMGWEPQLGDHACGRHGYLSGTDDQRLADLNRALRSPENDAIWCLRGGYGTMRILDRIDWGAARTGPVR
jgi:muramoyltetrapeptide carboxypeptidase